MFSQIALGFALLVQRVRRFLIKIYMIPPFEPVCPDYYRQIASEPVTDKLPIGKVEEFHHEVDAFMTNWDVDNSGMRVVKALSLFSNDEYECNKLYFPIDKSERENLHYGRMFEVLVREDGVYVAMFITATNLTVCFDEHQFIANPDLLEDRKVRYMDDFTGLIYRVLPEVSGFIYNPDRPVVVYKARLPDDHPLKAWYPSSNESESNDNHDSSR